MIITARRLASGGATGVEHVTRFLAPTGDDLRTVIMETVNVRPTAPKSSELNAALRRPAESRTLDAQARLYAAIALAQRGDPSQVPAVIAALNGSESGLRENAVARVFAELGVSACERQSGAAVRAEERSVESTRGVRPRRATRRSGRRGRGLWRAVAGRWACRSDAKHAGPDER